MIKVSKKGVKFPYHGDIVMFFWSKKEGHRWWSENYLLSFPSLRDYWKFVGSTQKDAITPGARLQGYSYVELLTGWVNHTFGKLNVVVIKDLDPDCKGLSFWARIPKEKAEELMNDIVVLHCSDKKEVHRIVDSIGEDFAEAYGFSQGKLINFNCLWKGNGE